MIQNINRTSFTPDFKKQIWRVIDKTRLRVAFNNNRRKIREVISKISVKFFLMGYPKKLREPIIQNEDELKRVFRIKIFTDYRILDQSELSETLESFLPQTEKNFALMLSSTIKEESEKCFNILEDMGIFLN